MIAMIENTMIWKKRLENQKILTHLCSFFCYGRNMERMTVTEILPQKLTAFSNRQNFNSISFVFFSS